MSDDEPEDSPSGFSWDDEEFARSEETYTEVISSDPMVEDAFDALPFLERFATLQTGALDELREGMSKGFGQQEGFNKSLATCMGALSRLAVRQGNLIKSLSARLEGVESAPMPRRAVSGTAPIRKSMGAPADDGALSGAQVEHGFMRMTEASHAAGRGGLSKSGEDLADAWSIFSKSGALSPGVMQELNETVGGQ